MKKENNLTDDERSEIAKLNAEYQDCVFSLGELFLKKTQLEKQLNEISEDESELLGVFENMTKKESDFMSRLESKYGIGKLDINSATYISS
tara:strand:- start:344 stop:616 length:273 start_codon:yes stop_codon:yes gene_type:complete